MYDVASLIVTALVLPLFGLIGVCLRFYVRLRLKPSYIGIDDWLIVSAIVLVYGQSACQILSAIIGQLGRDNEPTVPWRIKNESKIDLAVLIFEKATYTTIKLSVLFFFRRVFGSNDTFRRINNTLIVVILAWGLTFLIGHATDCGADSHLGHPCQVNTWLTLWFAITDVIGDMMILALPYPMIRKLQMERREKIGVSAIFLLGFISTIFGAVRMVFVAKNFHTYFHPSFSQTSHGRSAPNFWTTAEVSMNVLAACLPPLGPLIRKAPFPKTFVTKPRRQCLPSFVLQSSDCQKGIRKGGAGEDKGGEVQKPQKVRISHVEVQP